MAGFDKSKRSVVKHKTHTPFTPGQRSAGPPFAQGRGGSRSGRGGFKVGPSHAPDGAYLGKAKKIKANLIANAKTKKRFFKSITGDQSPVDHKGKRRADSTGEERYDDDDDDDDDEAQQAQSSSATKKNRSRRGPSSSAAPSPFFRKPDLGRFAREGDEEDGELFRGPAVDSRRTKEAGTEDATQRRRDRAGPAPTAGSDAPRSAATGSSKDRRSPPSDPSTAEQGRVSNRPFHPGKPQTAPVAPRQETAAPRSFQPHRTREEAIEARKKRQEAWNATTKGGPRSQRRKGGQPDLGKRMEVLLGRIEETK